MTYGDDKIKDIAEGILPAKRNAARASRRERRRIHKTERVRSRRQIDAGDDGSLAMTEARHEIRSQMWTRRQADNLSALFRWAEQTTKHIADPEDRYLAVRAVLPDSLIGRHALSHIAQLDGFQAPGRDPNRPYHRWGPSTGADREEVHAGRVVALTELAGTNLGAVNAWLKAHATCRQRREARASVRLPSPPPRRPPRRRHLHPGQPGQRCRRDRRTQLSPR